ncbi:MAG: M48 family metallopeptidase [Caulobacterales bacterium]
MRVADEPFITELETLDGRRVAVRLVINPRARRISVRIDPTRREAVAVSPSKRQASKALAFAASRAGWIAQQLARLPVGLTFAPGAKIPLRGTLLELVQERGRGPARIEGESLVVPTPEGADFQARVKRHLVQEARAALSAYVAVHAAKLGVAPSRITIKDTKSRWGSCSTTGALAFSWRIVLAPEPVIDYLAAHEVAHLREMNHGPRFWACVKLCNPNHQAARDWLHRHGADLHRFG